MANEAQNPATGGIPKTAKEFNVWLANLDTLTAAQSVQVNEVRLSFNMLAMNKNNPAAFAKAKQMHDRDMAKLEAMFGSPLSE